MTVFVECQGAVVRVKEISNLVDRKKCRVGARRGKVTGFSRKSRRRLIDLVCRLDTQRCRRTFVTLTFKSIPSVEEASKAFVRFRKRLERAYPGMSGFWRKERQARGSIHYHLMLFDLPYIEQRKLQAVWTECTGEERSIAHITLIKSHRGVMRYVSKYVAKAEGVGGASLDDAPYSDAADQPSEGRQWGIINRAALPFAERRIGVICDDQVAKYLLWCCMVAATGRKGERVWSQRWYTDDAQTVFAVALRWGGFELTSNAMRIIVEGWSNQDARLTLARFFSGARSHH